MTVYRYVDTLSSGGDGTTRSHSGASAAYASLNACLSALGTLTDHTVVRCAGSTADTTATSTSGITIGAYSLTICGDEGQDDSSGGGDNGTGFDNDGYYSGDLDYSNSHYILDQGSAFDSFEVGVPAVTIEKLQFRNTRDASGAVGIKASHNNTVVRQCRINVINGVAIKVGASSFQSYPDEISNNLITGTASTGIELGRASNAGARTTNVYNNTIDGAITGIKLLSDAAGNNDDTWNVKNNCCVNCTTDFDGLNLTNPTINSTHNAGEGTAPTGHDSNWVQLSATITDDLTDPENVGGRGSLDFTPVSGGGIDNEGIGSGTDSNVPTVDISGGSRSTSTPSIGAFEVAAASSQTLTPLLFTNAQTFYSPTVTQPAQDLDVSLFTNAQTFYPLNITQDGGAQDLNPSTFINTHTFFTHTVVSGWNLDAGLFTDTQTFYPFSITQDAAPQTLFPGVFSNNQTFYPLEVFIGAGQILEANRTDNEQKWFYHNMTGGARSNAYDLLQEIFKLSNRAQGRMKSKFPELNNIPVDASFDFVSNGVNYKIPIVDFLASLSVTGTLVQDGAASGVPILDKQGSVNNIRNLEPGAGITASVSAENGITLAHNFQNGSGGEPIITNISAASPQIANIIAGTGITVTSVAGGIVISLT